MRRTFLLPLLAVSVAACPPPPRCTDREACTDDVIRSWAATADARPWTTGPVAHPVAVYADRSGSMRGFLDPAYPTQTDYRSVIDGLQARLSPRVVFGFGNNVRRETQPGLGVMGSRDWYGDRNTETEQALDTIAADSAHGWTHIVVTDGRRGDPNHGYGQFVRMRQLAQEWIRAGGTFMVAVSLAPFTPVKDDPSGCHAEAGGRAAAAPPANGGLRCPLYAFAFAAPGDGMRVGATLAQLFDHVWLTPAPTAPGRMAALRADAAPAGTVSFDAARLLTADSGAVPMVEGTEPATDPLRLHLELPDTTSPAGHLLAALVASGTQAVLSAAPISGDSGAAQWIRQDGRTGAVRVDPAGRSLQAFSPGGDDCRAAAPNDPCGTLYRLELYTTGAPAWLPDFEARDASDVERTFGLGRLFEPFRAAPPSAPLARAYLLLR